MEELKRLQASAVEEQVTLDDDTDKQAFIDKVVEIADKTLKDSLSEIDDPIVHKVMAMKILSNLIAWHTEVSNSMIKEDGVSENSTSWMRDAGKFQAALVLLHDVSLGDNDFVTPLAED